MRKIKKWAACLLLAAILLELLQSPADAKTKKLSGSCGETATYAVDEEGTLMRM